MAGKGAKAMRRAKSQAQDPSARVSGLPIHERDEARAVARRLRQVIDQIQLEMGSSETGDRSPGAAVLDQANDLVNELEAEFLWLEEEDGDVD
jgi:hypothetical protein